MNIQAATVERLSRQLINIGAEVFVRYEGLVFGEAPKPAQKRPRKNKGVTQFVEEKLKGFEVGAVVSLSHPEYPLESLQAVAASVGGKIYGRGNVTTSINRTTNAVDVLRLQ